jgi:hypothetical protein
VPGSRKPPPVDLEFHVHEVLQRDACDDNIPAQPFQGCVLEVKGGEENFEYLDGKKGHLPFIPGALAEESVALQSFSRHCLDGVKVVGWKGARNALLMVKVIMLWRDVNMPDLDRVGVGEVVQWFGGSTCREHVERCFGGSV